MQIANGVEMLEISAVVMGKTNTLYPALIRDEDHVVLIDTGYPGQVSNFKAAIEQAGIRFDSLDIIIISHQDLDHIGSLPDFVQASQQRIQVLASEGERPYIQGDKKLVKLTPEAIAQAIKSIPPEVPEQWRKAFQAMLENPPKAAVDRTIAGGEELPYGGGLIVIDTAGHTPGHISLYHKSSKTLIAGDALVIVEGQLHGSIPAYTYDSEQAGKSIQRLAGYDIESVICYHGGLYQGNANQRIAELASNV